MHRRVAHTAAAVVPHAYSAERFAQDPARVVPDNPNYYGTQDSDVYIPRQESSDLGGYDLTTNDDNEPHHWRRLDSRGESILSGLEGPDEEENDRFRGSPESMLQAGSLSRVVEEDTDRPAPTDLEPGYVEEAMEWELEQNGLYGGSYQQLLALYTFVPLSALITFTVLAMLPVLAWPHSSSPSHYPPLFPSPLPEIFLSSAVFALTHQLRVPLYTISSLLLPPDIASLLSTFLHVLLVNVFRLASLALLRVRHDMHSLKPTWQDSSYHTVWWLSLNVAEVLVALIQGYQHIMLYRDVMVPPGREQEFLDRLKDEAIPLQRNGDPVIWRDSAEQLSEDSLDDVGQIEDQTGSRGNANALNWRIQQNVDKLLTIRAREELEEVYGMAPIKIPVFVSCLQRFDSVILSVGLTLLISSAYLRSPLSVPVADGGVLPYPIISHKPLMITFPIVLVVHTSLSSLYTPVVLPRIGIHTAAYVSVLVSLMCFFAGLAVWGVLS